MTDFKTMWVYTFLILFFLSTPSLVTADQNINSEFRIAAALGQMQRLENLLEKGADVNSGGPSTEKAPAGITALIMASTYNHLDIVQFLISKGANVNQADEGGGTALIYAVWKGYEDIVALLLKNGADIYARTIDGRTPLSVAKQSGHTEIEKMLKAAAKK